MVFSNFCGLSVCGWWPGGWCTVVIVGCQGPVVGAIYVFECVKNFWVSVVGVVWSIPVCRFVDKEWFGAENVNASVQKHAGTKRE